MAFLRPSGQQPGQIGVICRIGGVLAGLDLLGSEALFARAFPKLARGSALQALAGFDKDGSASLDDETFLNAALSSQSDRFPAVGLGEDLRIDTEGDRRLCARARRQPRSPLRLSAQRET